MPTYDYRCEACKHRFEEFHSMTAKSIRKCPKCGKLSVKRLIGRGAGIIFKGSGFYQTDYKKTSKEPAKPAADNSPKKETPAKELKKSAGGSSKKDS
ncbi:MAG TPA: zinc ribbon domain-containing protein [bacterium]|nr:zinc ribbon domain-containing protein [bacterium]